MPFPPSSGPWLTAVRLWTLCWGRSSDSVRRWSGPKEPRCSWWTWGQASCTPDCSTSPERRRRTRQSWHHVRRTSGFLSAKEWPAVWRELVKLTIWRRRTPANISILQSTNRFFSSRYLINCKASSDKVLHSFLEECRDIVLIRIACWKD